MLTIQHDPAGISGRERHAWDFALTIQQNVELHLASGFECDAFLNGYRVDPLTDERFDAPPSVADQLWISRRPGATPIEWFYIASTIFSIGAAIYSYRQSQRSLDEPVVSESPNNKLTAQTNIARAYQAIPDVYGLRRVWPDLLQNSLVEYVNHEKFVTELLCISRGKGTITEQRFADTPIADIEGSNFVAYEPAATPNAFPEFNLTTVPDVVEPFPSPEVNGQTIEEGAALQTISIGNGLGNGIDGGGEFGLMEFPDGPELDDLKAAVASTVFLILAPSWQYTVTVSSFAASSGTPGFVEFKFYVPAGTSSAFGSIFSYAPTRYVAGTTGAASIGPFTLPIDNATRIQWNMVFLRGLKGTVNIRAEWWKIDSAGAEISGTRESTIGTPLETYSADSYSGRYFTRAVVPAAGAGRYRIEFTRLTADLGNGADVAQLEGLFALRTYATKTFPGVTVARVTTRATTSATGFRDRKFNVRFARHVRTLASTTLSASRNFGRIMAHVWTLAGEDIADLDTTTLATINSSLGEDSPLLRFDGSLDDANVSLGERLQRIAYHARCDLWRDGAQWTVTRDQTRTAPVLQLDYRNLAAAGDSTISYSAHLPASNDGVEVEYTDETTQATKAYIRKAITSGAPVDGLPQNPLKIQLTGCATQAQAEDRAQLEARRLLYQRTSVADQALADGGMLGLGSLVRWVDPNDFVGDDGLQAGEVMAFAGSTVTLSEPVDFRGNANARIAFTGATGAYLGAAVLCTPGAAANQVILSTVPSYLSTGIFVRDGDSVQVGSRYAFGPGLTDAELTAAGLYVVTEVKPRADRTFEIGLVNYDARMYSNVIVLGIATEADASQPMGRLLGRAIGQVIESDAALAVTSA